VLLPPESRSPEVFSSCKIFLMPFDLVFTTSKKDIYIAAHKQSNKISDTGYKKALLLVF
jgi:hypothetical protein